MVDSTVKYIAIGNQGGIFMLVSEYPRKELMERMHASRAEKCYIDKLDGTSAHVGYIVAGQWFTLYAVEGRGVREGWSQMIEITDREAEALSIHLEYTRQNRPDQPIGRTLEALADRLYRLTIFKIIVEETIDERK